MSGTTTFGIAVAGAILFLASPVLARDYCTSRPRHEWMNVSEAIAKAERLGYRVTEIERDGSCYEIEGRDARGRKIEADMNPVTGAIVRIKKYSRPRSWTDGSRY